MVGNLKREACAQCTHHCALFHRKGKNSSSSSSSSSSSTTFFKIMLGDDFSRILYFPPKFCRTMSDLVDEKIILVDSSGNQWNSRVSNVGGSLALEEGWNKFSLDHELEVGDFLVFNFVNESHFDVIIFDRSGCAWNDFSKRKNKRKRSMDRSGSGSSDRDAVFVRQGPNAPVVSEPDLPKMDGQNREVDVGGTRNNMENTTKYDKSNGSALSLCVEEYCEGPCHMTSQDKHGVNGTGKITTGESKVSHIDYGSHAHQNDATPFNIRPLYEGILGSGGGTSNATEVKLSGNNNTHRDTDRSACNKISTSKLEESRKNDFIKSKGEVQEGQFATDRSAYNKTSTLKLEENRKNNYVKSNREVQESQFAKGVESDQVVGSKKKHKMHVDRHHNTKQMSNDITNIPDDIPNGETSNRIKQESAPEWQPGMTRNKISFKGKLRAKGEMSKKIKKELHMGVNTNVPNSNYELGATGSGKVIKKELVESSDMIDQDYDDYDDDVDIQTSASISCVVPTDNDNFLELPTPLPYSCRGRLKMGRMVVFLRNPKDTNNNLWPVLYHEQPMFKILAAGWSQFRSANNIQPADVCTFGVEDKSKRIFTIDIVHN